MFNRRHYHILSERYFETLIGDFTSLIWMVGQAPLIAAVIILRWRGYQATETLYFVMAISAVWFGCINACREIAREKAIFARERLFGINIPAYVMSKVKVLMLMGLLEIGLFAFLLSRFLVLDLFLPLAFLAMLGLYFTGMSLGLFLSEWTGNVPRAVVSVPVAIIPQIVFSKFVLPADTLKGAALKIEKLMPAKWGFESLTHAKKGAVVSGDFLWTISVLLGLGILLLVLTWVHLLAADEG